MKWKEIAEFVGLAVALGTLAAGFGYGWPWETPAQAAQIDQREQKHYESLTQQIKDTNRNIDNLTKQESADSLNARVNLLLINKALIESALSKERKGSSAYILLSTQLHSINGQLHKMGM